MFLLLLLLFICLFYYYYYYFFFLLLIYTSSVDVLLEFTRVQGLKINICLFIFVTCNMRQPYRTFVLPLKMSRMENRDVTTFFSKLAIGTNTPAGHTT